MWQMFDSGNTYGALYAFSVTTGRSMLSSGISWFTSSNMYYNITGQAFMEVV